MRAVFVPGGLPKHTYVPRSNLRLEEQLRAATDNLCKLVTVTGPTKSGKSVLTQVGGFGLASHDPPQFLVVPRAILLEEHGFFVEQAAKRCNVPPALEGWLAF
jgi:hypothetical protein